MFLLQIFLVKEILCSLKMNIPHNRDKCFIENCFDETIIFIKYIVSGYDKNLDMEELKLILNGIVIFIKNNNENKIYEQYLNERRGKFGFLIKKAGEYRICTRFYSKTIAKKLSDNVVIGLKIKKSNDKKILNKSLKKIDIKDLDKKIKNYENNIINLNHEIINLIREDNKLTNEIKISGDLFKVLNIIQTIIMLFTGIIYLIYFLNYLKRKNVL